MYESVVLRCRHDENDVDYRDQLMLESPQVRNIMGVYESGLALTIGPTLEKVHARLHRDDKNISGGYLKYYLVFRIRQKHSVMASNK